MARAFVRDPRDLPLALAVLLALAVVPELPSLASRPTVGWRGWYVVWYRGDAAAAVEASLSALEARSISRASATVKVDAFSEIETLPVADLGARLDPLDPRRDAWLAGADRFFRAGHAGADVGIAYVAATRGRLSAWWRLARAFDDAGVPRDAWRLAELEPTATLARPAAALCFAAALAWWLRRGASALALAGIGVLVWLPGLLNGGVADLCLCCVSLYLWLPRATAPERREERRSPRRGTEGPAEQPARTALRIGVLIVATAAVVAVDGAALYRTTRTAASVLGLELLAAAVWLLPRRHRPTRHAPGRFAPVPIRAPRHRVLVPFAAGLVALGIAVAPLCRSRLRLPLPTPVSLARAGSGRGIEAAARGAGPDRLPGLAEAVVHAASLQTLALTPVVGRATAADGVDPPPTEARVRLPEIAEGADGTSLVEEPRTVARFEPGWLDRFLDGLPVNAVERLLLDQRRAVVVGVRSLRPGLSGTLPIALFLLALLGAPLAGPASRRLLIRLDLWAITEPVRKHRTR